MKIAIGAGHSPNCIGAQGNGYDEHDEAVKCVDYFIQLCKNHGITVYNCFDDSYNKYENLYEQVKHANAHPVDLAIQWHFNSVDDNTATGCEVEYHSGSIVGNSYAYKVSKVLSNTLDLTNRGCKYPQLYWTSNTDAPAILIETCFISNAGDMKSYEKHRDELVEAVFTAITGVKVNKVETPVIPLAERIIGVHLATPGKTNRTKWRRTNGYLLNVATHTYLDISGDVVKKHQPVRVAPKKTGKADTQIWGAESYSSSGFDTYIKLYPDSDRDLVLTRTCNCDGAGVEIDTDTNNITQKWTAVYAGEKDTYYLFATGTYFALCADLPD